jgi:tmRNA-binding protein
MTHKIQYLFGRTLSVGNYICKIFVFLKYICQKVESALNVRPVPVALRHDKRETEKARDWNREKGRLVREKG